MAVHECCNKEGNCSSTGHDCTQCRVLKRDTGLKMPCGDECDGCGSCIPDALSDQEELVQIENHSF